MITNRLNVSGAYRLISIERIDQTFNSYLAESIYYFLCSNLSQCLDIYFDNGCDGWMIYLLVIKYKMHFNFFYKAKQTRQSMSRNDVFIMIQKKVWMFMMALNSVASTNLMLANINNLCFENVIWEMFHLNESFTSVGIHNVFLALVFYWMDMWYVAV